MEDTWSVGIEGKEFLERPVSQAMPQLASPEYQERNSVVNSKVNRPWKWRTWRALGNILIEKAIVVVPSKQHA